MEMTVEINIERIYKALYLFNESIIYIATFLSISNAWRLERKDKGEYHENIQNQGCP